MKNDPAQILKSKRGEILRIAAQHGARNVRVFGSVARGEADPQSDVDLLVEMEPGRSLFDLARLLNRHSPDRTTFPGYSSRRDAANYNPAFQGRQMRPDSLKSLLPWTNHRPAKRKSSKPLVYDQVSSLGSPFALYDPVTVINPDAPKVD